MTDGSSGGPLPCSAPTSRGTPCPAETWPFPAAAAATTPGALARRGYRVCGFDFAPGAIRAARELAARDGVAVTFEERDVFRLAEAYPGFFDGVWEYTCFCAIDPARRAEYVDVLTAILRPGGWLLACFFPMGSASEHPARPPFPVTETEVRGLLAGRFDLVEAYVPFASAEGRQGREWMVSARRGGGAPG